MPSTSTYPGNIIIILLKSWWGLIENYGGWFEPRVDSAVYKYPAGAFAGADSGVTLHAQFLVSGMLSPGQQSQLLGAIVKLPTFAFYSFTFFPSNLF